MKVYAIDNRLENTGGKVNRNERKNRRYHTHFSVISRTNFLKNIRDLNSALTTWPIRTPQQKMAEHAFNNTCNSYQDRLYSRP